MKRILLCGMLLLGLLAGCKQADPAADSSGFVNVTDVVPDAILEIRYFGTYNFVGARVDGYLEPTALLTRQAADTLMRPYFYPNVDRTRLFELGYIAEKSGHTRGSTLDLTLFDMASGKELDMGGVHDWFGPESHPDYCGNPDTYFTFPVKKI